MELNTLAIVGVGLIGGSAGLAARRRRVAGRVIGVDNDPGRLRQALAAGAIDQGLPSITEAARVADFVLVAVPVDGAVQAILTAAGACGPGAVLTDTGSTKRTIVRAVERAALADRFFVGGHPLAGSEKKGVEHARADLFENRLALLTPTEQTARAALDRVAGFWQSLGAAVDILTPEEHDAVIARTSHLPHVVAGALAAGLAPGLARFAAQGFRDTTRLAAGDPDLWAAILMDNRDNVCGALRDFHLSLGKWLTCLDREDHHGLRNLLAEAKRARDALGS